MILDKIKTADDKESLLLIEYLNNISRIQDDDLHKRLLKELIARYVELEKRVDSLLKNTLPAPVAEEIKATGKYEPRMYECTILFTDLVGFTKLAERMPPWELITLLDYLFKNIDDIVDKYRGTKIKTIGDAYMAVFGTPITYANHAEMAIKAALCIISFLENTNRERGLHLEMRVGIHTGRVMTGVVGKERMQFDIFGDDVNTASRFESSGVPGRVNVSQSTYAKTKDKFLFEERGKIPLKSKGEMNAYLVIGEVM